MTKPSDQPTIILSDLHLGRPDAAAQAHRFAALVRPFARVIINGDVAELHHARYRSPAEAELDRLREFCAKSGAELDLIAGNHDPFVSDVRARSLHEDALYVTHGDALHPAIAPWSPYASSMKAAYAAALRANPSRDEHAARLASAREASMAEWRGMGDGAYISTIAGFTVRPLRALVVLDFWRRYPTLVHDWATRFAPNAGTVVVGHSHRAFVREINGLRIVNTGAYSFPGRPLAVVVDRGAVRVHRIEMENRLFELSARPIAEWTLTRRDGSAPRESAPTRNRPQADDAASTRLMNAAASASAARSMDV